MFLKNKKNTLFVFVKNTWIVAGEHSVWGVCGCVCWFLDEFILLYDFNIYSESLNYLFLSVDFFCIVINTGLSVL